MYKNIEEIKDIISSYTGPKLRIMEVCGTHTHQIFKLGIRQILPENIELISGPGCPVCVTAVSYIDEAVMLALEHKVTVITFGDLLRVPGSRKSLAEARAMGAKIKIVYSPLDALQYAADHLREEVVFLSVGFETTTPGSAIAVRNAKKEEIHNFSVLTANKTMHQAYLALEKSADAFLYPGHVSTMTGMNVYRSLRDEKGISGVVTGFTATEILTALAVIIIESQKGKPFAVNAYPSVVTEEGSEKARKIVDMIMEPCDAEWRGLGIISGSGLKLRNEYKAYDARKKFSLPQLKGETHKFCRCGEVLRGKCKPYECKLFGRVCTPEHPVGACMVSGEGACSAFYKYGGSLWRIK